MVHLIALVSTCVLAASLIPSVVAVPIQSSAFDEGLVERQLSLPSRGYADTPIRGSVSTPHKRDLVTRAKAEELAELVRRNPEPFFLFKLAAKGIGALINKIKNRKKKRDLGDITSEELDLLSRADPEELAALMVRNPEPFLPLLSLTARQFFSADYENVFEREFAELEEMYLREMEAVEDIKMQEYDHDEEMAARGWAELNELD